MTENFTKITKYLTKLKETLTNYVWEIPRHKTVRIKFSVDFRFSSMLCGKKRKPGNVGNQQKAF